MSRTTLSILLGVTTAVILAVIAIIFGRTYFIISAQNRLTPTPTIAISDSLTATPTATVTAPLPSETTATPPFIIPTVAATPSAAPATPTTIVVLSTSVQFVQAKTDLNIRSGPGTNFAAIGWLSSGQTVRVTGVSSDGNWWYIQCLNGGSAGCWVTARSQYSQPVSEPSSQPDPVTMSGVIYQDVNQSGVYEVGEPLMANREVWLTADSACHLRQAAVATARSGADGVYTFKGSYSGSYCLGLPNQEGELDDVVAVSVAPGQVLTQINLKALLVNGSISGFVWSDLCQVSQTGEPTAGSCVAVSGGYRANGMIEPNENNIAGVTVSLQLGACLNNPNVSVTAVTDASGRYTFGNLQAATYCVTIEPTLEPNVGPLLPGSHTFPDGNLWQQEITLLPHDNNAFSVNFGWDYQLQ